METEVTAESFLSYPKVLDRSAVARRPWKSIGDRPRRRRPPTQAQQLAVTTSDSGASAHAYLMEAQVWMSPTSTCFSLRSRSNNRGDLIPLMTAVRSLEVWKEGRNAAKFFLEELPNFFGFGDLQLSAMADDRRQRRLTSPARRRWGRPPLPAPSLTLPTPWIFTTPVAMDLSFLQLCYLSTMNVFLSEKTDSQSSSRSRGCSTHNSAGVEFLLLLGTLLVQIKECSLIQN